MKLGMQVGLGPGHFVLDGDPAPPSQKAGGAPQIFGPCLLRPNGWMDETGTWHGVGLSPGDFVLDGDPVPFPQKGRIPLPKFSAHLYCGEMAACIKMPLGMELGLGPGDFVLDGDPAQPREANLPHSC